MAASDELHRVLANYAGELQAGGREFLGSAGGFSGAAFWKLTTGAGVFCVRRWPPEHPSRQRLMLQHAVLAHAKRRGIHFVPVPVRTEEGRTWVRCGGHFWEITPWLPGKADFFPRQERAKLLAAAEALARFHRAVEDFPRDTCEGIAPAARQRLQTLEDVWRAVPKITSALKEAAADDPFAVRGEEILAGFRSMASTTRTGLAQAALYTVPLQPVIRDVWSDHILYEENAVTGIVDFGALRIDSLAVDVARLFGSMAGDDPDGWNAALRCYHRVRPLSAAEQALVKNFNVSTVVLAGMSWLRWIYIEARRFDDPAAVLARLEVTRRRLRHLVEERNRGP